ncbi:MAG: bifunctional [glutamine synthetase] adenylyltransferase/[glutamine synthetase]-adenylyl-L-tyrosine phosphorylase [Gammaproteobacteria bacterium]|nr:bifunctional [glutamine synthetase] adenylyltransferase/[glutamine synthetase]-adenylyl-L-tyrosine phosphorylase [Gammaproteobacteria bacterium]
MLALAAAEPSFESLRPYREAAARAGINRLRGAATRAGAEALEAALDTPAGQRFFAFLFGNSPFLGGLLMRDIAFAQTLATDAPDVIATRILDQLSGADPSMSRADLMQLLRVSRNRVALIAAAYDCFGVWDVMRCARLLSDFADHAVRLTVSHLLAQSVAQGDLAALEDGRWGYFVLAMGKQGARELNYSSDIDLIAIYDPGRVRYQGAKTARDHFSRLTHAMVSILESRNADGYVFRTDLRLRPDAASTPAAITADFALDYYRERGRTWERAAFIKARPVAGDLAAGTQFLERMKPFVWDEALDFRSVEDIRSMSEQIHDFHGHGEVKLAGQNVKLGRGGIREIEFFVHMHQLAYGGRNRRLRGAGVLSMLDVLERELHLMPKEAETLKAAYALLRRVEHRLQMVNDNQTQTLPASDDGLAHIAAFMNLASKEDLGALLGGVFSGVHALYRARFNVPERQRQIAEAVLAGRQGTPDAISVMQAAGFTKPEAAVETLRGWLAGRHPSTASEAVRAALGDVLEDVVEALGRTPDPDRALTRLDAFLSRLPGDLPLFPMLRANTWLVNLIAVVMGVAPRMANLLDANPHLLQAALDPSFFLPMPDPSALAAELEERLDQGGSFRERVDRVAAWADDRQFQVGVQALQNLITLDEASASRSHIARAVIEVLYGEVAADVRHRRGDPAGRGCAIVALGDLGAEEMAFGSPLELLLVADFEVTAGRGWAQAARYVHGWTARRLGAALRRTTRAGALYETVLTLVPLAALEAAAASASDLRPEDHGPDGDSVNPTALSRAAVIGGDTEAMRAAAAAIQSILSARRDAVRLAGAMAAMRNRRLAEAMAEDPFDLRNVAGGLRDLEIIARHLQWTHAHRSPGVLASGVAAAFEALAGADVVTADEGQSLAGAVRLQRGVEAYLRLTWSHDAPVRDAPDTLKARLAHALACDGFDALEGRLRDAQQRAFAAFRKYVK